MSEQERQPARARNSECAHRVPHADEVRERRIARINCVTIVLGSVLLSERDTLLFLLAVSVVLVDFVDRLGGERSAHGLRVFDLLVGSASGRPRTFPIAVALWDAAQRQYASQTAN